MMYSNFPDSQDLEEYLRSFNPTKANAIDETMSGVGVPVFGICFAEGGTEMGVGVVTTPLV